MDDNGLLYLRARYYNPAAGVFTALDPFEGIQGRPMSLNGYSWVEGNVPNRVDPTGMWGELPSMYAPCSVYGISDDRCLDPSLTCETRCGCWQSTGRLGSLGYEACLKGCRRPGAFFEIIDFPDSEYPGNCSGRTAEDCALYQLDFLVHTDTIRYLNARYRGILPLGIMFPYDLQLFISFVAPDKWNPHPGSVPGQGGTPLDIKWMYDYEYREYMTLFGNRYKFDYVGNMAFGYAGYAAGLDEKTLLGGASLAELPVAGTLDPLTDSAAILAGIDLYKTCGDACTSQQFKDVLKKSYPLYSFGLQQSDE